MQYVEGTFVLAREEGVCGDAWLPGQVVAGHKGDVCLWVQIERGYHIQVTSEMTRKMILF